MSEKVFRDLRDYFGTYTKMAALIGVSITAVQNWRRAGAIPAGSAIKIERLTGGQFKAVDLAE